MSQIGEQAPGQSIQAPPQRLEPRRIIGPQRAHHHHPTTLQRLLRTRRAAVHRNAPLPGSWRRGDAPAGTPGGRVTVPARSRRVLRGTASHAVTAYLTCTGRVSRAAAGQPPPPGTGQHPCSQSARSRAAPGTRGRSGWVGNPLPGEGVPADGAGTAGRAARRGRGSGRPPVTAVARKRRRHDLRNRRLSLSAAYRCQPQPSPGRRRREAGSSPPAGCRRQQQGEADGRRSAEGLGIPALARGPWACTPGTGASATGQRAARAVVTRRDLRLWASRPWRLDKEESVTRRDLRLWASRP